MRHPIQIDNATPTADTKLTLRSSIAYAGLLAMLLAASAAPGVTVVVSIGFAAGAGIAKLAQRLPRHRNTSDDDIHKVCLPGTDCIKT